MNRTKQRYLLKAVSITVGIFVMLWWLWLDTQLSMVKYPSGDPVNQPFPLLEATAIALLVGIASLGLSMKGVVGVE